MVQPRIPPSLTPERDRAEKAQEDKSREIQKELERARDIAELKNNRGFKLLKGELVETILGIKEQALEWDARHGPVSDVELARLIGKREALEQIISLPDYYEQRARELREDAEPTA